LKKSLIYTCAILLATLFYYGCENQAGDKPVLLSFDQTVSNISLNKAFKITLPDNHPDKIAILTPDDNWFYIQGNGIKKQLMPKEDFIKSSTLSIDPATIEGTHWVDGKEKISPVFTKKGIYSIYLSDNLETEIDNSLTFIKKIELKD